MNITRAAKKSKTKAAGGRGAAVPPETSVQSCRKPAKGPDSRNGCGVLRESTRMLCIWLFVTPGFDGNQHGPCCHRQNLVCMHIIRNPLCVLKKNKHFLAFSEVTASCYLVA